MFLRIQILLSALILMVSESPALAGQGIEAAQKAITGPIVIVTIIAAAAGLLKGAIQFRKGVESEGMGTIQGACICLIVISSLYLIVSFITGD